MIRADAFRVKLHTENRMLSVLQPHDMSVVGHGRDHQAGRHILDHQRMIPDGRKGRWQPLENADAIMADLRYLAMHQAAAPHFTAEVLADTVTLILPVTTQQITQAFSGLRLWPLLDGYRGRPRADIAAIADIARRLGDLMLTDASLEEIEINPILVRPQGAVAVDALIRRA